MQPAEVRAYSGQSYGERPASFVSGGVEFRVKLVSKEWREPGEKVFLVRTLDDRSFELRYNEQNDQWLAEEVG